MLLGLKCILFNFIAMYPSELNVRACMPPVLTKKKREEASTGQYGGPELIRNHHSGSRRRNQQWRNQYHVDRWYILRPTTRRIALSSSYRHIAKRSEIGNPSSRYTPPKLPFAISSENGNWRMLSEAHYHAHSGAMEIERQWLGFSSTMKKPSGKSCWLLGDPSQTEELRTEDQIDTV